jgi:hypothetical protein
MGLKAVVLLISCVLKREECPSPRESRFLVHLSGDGELGAGDPVIF